MKRELEGYLLCAEAADAARDSLQDTMLFVFIENTPTNKKRYRKPRENGKFVTLPNMNDLCCFR